jgi:hypothetical protein
MTSIKAVQFFEMIENLNNVKRVGLDYHGVIDTYPTELCAVTYHLQNKGIEVYVITGNSADPAFIENLTRHKIFYKSIFSIIDYHTSIGTDIRYDEKGNPWIAPELWNSTKALICEKNDIDIHIDDSNVYGCYFKKRNRYFYLRDGIIYPEVDLPIVYVKYDPVLEGVICVHSSADEWCEKCRKVEEENKKHSYWVSGDWFEIQSREHCQAFSQEPVPPTIVPLNTSYNTEGTK